LSLPSVDIKDLGELPFRWEVEGGLAWNTNSLPLDTWLGDNYLFAATRKHGIYIFSLKGKKATCIDKKKRLPSNCIHSLAVMDNVIYFGSGVRHREAYIQSYDLKRKQLTTGKMTTYPAIVPDRFFRPEAGIWPVGDKILFASGFGVWLVELK